MINDWTLIVVKNERTASMIRRLVKEDAVEVMGYGHILIEKIFKDIFVLAEPGSDLDKDWLKLLDLKVERGRKPKHLW